MTSGNCDFCKTRPYTLGVQVVTNEQRDAVERCGTNDRRLMAQQQRSRSKRPSVTPSPKAR